MGERVLLGRGRKMEAIDRGDWEKEVAAAGEKGRSRFDFMTPEHRAVRNFAVLEIPRRGRALSPEEIAEGTSLPLETVAARLDELEKRLFFLVRNGAGDVSWAFPVTVEPTGHRLRLSTGERLDAA